MTLKILGAFACDDIRTEVGERLSFMGVLGPDFQTQPFPANLRLAFVMIGTVDAAGPIELTTRVSFDGKPVAQASGMMEFQAKAKGLTIPFGPIFIRAERPGQIRLDVNTGSGWRRVQTWKVTPAPVEPTAV